ncbi:hypothetical protein KX928_20930 [Roseobacter sp. YSTF-M11]|uniref:Uncharacterized protein n=1 Tax=Roseobacter insulae TaxID=2859783 RepID=A0A9X1G077_9RHOB|nr:hypothetical protein [Roseobacter insulae]MBW4710260.1 hypothetical protein [Roseobacter insulae]
MRLGLTLILMTLGRAALACGTPVCLVDPEALQLTRIITFDDTRSSQGPGYLVPDLLVLEGAIFGERFAGQVIAPVGDHDQVDGAALPPLTVMPGDKGQNLSVVFMQGNNVLNGYGVAGYPKRHAQGEGAMAFLFDDDQSALSFQLRGGEEGTARAVFLRRDGQVIMSMDLPPAGEHAFGFIRATGIADIAGVVITNTDPQGLALDNVRFGKNPELS